MAKRITLTKSQAQSETGKRLIEMILALCHDGQLDISEIEELHAYLRRESSPFAAIEFLRAITRDCVADGSISDVEAYRLKQAFERVVPKDVREVVSSHLQALGLPSPSRSTREPAWTRHPATERQIEYITDLGGTVLPQMTKGQASQIIDELLDRRPPTPRQMMVLRFFDRLDLAWRTKDEVSLWLDNLYASDDRFEQAWERFKREANHDPFSKDPTVVPIGCYKLYLRPRRAGLTSGALQRLGCLLAMLAAGIGLVALWLGR